MKHFLAWLVGYQHLKFAYRFLGWPGVLIFLSAEGGLVVSVTLLGLVLVGVIA